MKARIQIALLVFLLTTASATAALNYWCGEIVVLDEEMGVGINFGVRPGYEDGYDGQSPTNLEGFSGVLLQLYHTWGGSPAFYGVDYESPIPVGGSKTWSDIWLWSQNYTPNLGNRTRLLTGCEPGLPSGYWGRLSLDYVPDSLVWTGPWQFDIRLDGYGMQFYLPVPITDNPWDPMNVTRMHLTVYTTPIPEPSSLLALGAGMLALAGLALRRRRK